MADGRERERERERQRESNLIFIFRDCHWFNQIIIMLIEEGTKTGSTLAVVSGNNSKNI